MYTCILCRFTVQYDDAVVPTAGGRCICLGCYTRETQTYRRPTPGLRRDVEDALAA